MFFLNCFSRGHCFSDLQRHKSASHEGGGVKVKMIRKQLLTAGCLLAFVASPALAGVTLSRDGKSDYVIAIADDAMANEQTAANELADYLKQVTGAQLSVIKESELTDRDGRLISVGHTKLAQRALGDVKWDDLAHDGIVVRTVGNTLFLAGGRPRGTGYAVNTFLEDVVGVRWWTSDESIVPSKPTLEVPDQNILYVPRIGYRESYYHDVTRPGKHAAFAARLKLNGHHHQIPPEFGGHYSLIGFCHTSFSLIHPNEYFASHPEWFALRDGKRQTETQLCLSNAEMRKTLIQNALERVRQQPESGIISISQNDGYGPCDCEDCKAIATEEGSESGPWIRLCNEAAEAINKEYPDFLVETLAYVYSRKPPKLVKPSKNVLVRLCSIEADFAHPLSQDPFGDDLRGWAKIAPNLFVWNYVTNFKNYLVPHANLASQGEDLRFFVDNHVVGVFEQGDYFNLRAGDMLPLRLWLQAHLLWDPSRDQESLTREFLDGYYGAASPYLAQYLELINSVSKNPEARVYCFQDNLDYLTPEVVAKCNRLFDEVLGAVAGQVELEQRLKRERLALEHLGLLRYDFTAAIKKANGDSKAAVGEYRRRVREWAAAAEAAGVHNQSEMQGFASYVPGLEMRGEEFDPPTLPAAGAALPDGEFDIQQDQFSLHQPPTKSELVNDLIASDGRAAKMPGNQSDWAIQFHIAKDAKFAGDGPWMCYIVARCENVEGDAGVAFQYGIYGSRGFAALSSAEMRITSDGKYHAYAIPVARLDPGTYFFVAPVSLPNAESRILVDRIFIRRTDGIGQ